MRQCVKVSKVKIIIGVHVAMGLLSTVIKVATIKSNLLYFELK